MRGEIEQMEGRLRVLKDLTSMTTVELFVDEIKDYVPEDAGGPTARRAAPIGGGVCSRAA
jgi:hypothetical protein